MKRSSTARLATVAAVQAAAMLALASPAWGGISVPPAGTFTVNDSGDSSDATRSDGRCETSAGTCTLRAAVEQANATTGEDTVNFSVSRVELSEEELLVEGDLTINGGGVVIDAGGTTAFVVTNGVELTISRVLVEDGFRAFQILSESGEFSASQTGTTLNLSDSIVRNSSGGGGLDVDYDTTANVTRTTFSGNEDYDNGGAIESFGTLTLTDSTLVNNTSNTDNGCFGSGALAVDGGTASVTNTTVSGNTSLSEDCTPGGGGLYASGGTLSLTNSTVADNDAPNEPGNDGIVVDGGTIQAKNTIAANNGGSGGENCDGTIASQGGNLEFPGTSCGFEVRANPRLGPLADNGGPTETRALAAGSPAIDAGAACPPPATDQRGVTRPQDGDANGSAVCDIGAFERRVAAFSVSDASVTEGNSGTRNATFTVTRSGGEGGESVAFATANGSAAAGSDYNARSGTLTFAAGETSKTVTVAVRGDTRDEPNETFRLVLTNRSGATISDGSGTATIRDDDQGGGPGGGCTITRGASNDVIRGTAGRDVICAGAGNDVVYGGGGNDTILGQGGNDALRGGDGDDRVIGGEGNDALRGEGGNDTILGEGGNDALNARDGVRGNDVADGGRGSNACSADPRDVRRSC